MPVTYVVTLEPVTENVDTIGQILIQYTESEQEVSELIEPGGVVIETEDKDEAKTLAEHLRSAGAEVEIERRESQPDEHTATVDRNNCETGVD